MLKTTYYCDICRDEIKNKHELLGVHFTNMKKFTLGNYGCTEGVHICYGCGRQLLAQLAKIDEIQEADHER